MPNARGAAKESSVVKEVASLGTVAIVALLFLAFLTTLRPRLIAAVQGRGDRYRANGLAHSEACSRAGTSHKMPGLIGQPR